MRSTLAAALVLASLATVPATAQVAVVPATIPDGTVLDIVATGMTTRVPDVATIRAGVLTQGATAAQALADNAGRMTRVLSALKAAGVQPRDIATANVSLQPQYRDEARIDAIKQARARADLFARAAGLSVASIMTISESGANAPPPPMPMYVARSAGLAKAATMIAPGETDVTVTVSVRFLLK